METVKSVQQQPSTGQNQPKPRPLPRGSSIEKPPSPKNRQINVPQSVNKPQTTQQVSQPRKQLPPLPQQQAPR